MQLAGQGLKPNRWTVSKLSYGNANGDLAVQVIVAQEAERRRFSREMHDDLAQKVALLEFQIEGMKRKFDQRDGATAELECLRTSVAALAEDLHRICYRLHPVVLDNLGLVAGVDFLCNEFARMSGVNPKFVSETVPDKVPSSVALCLYRVVQEALNNVHKHACAQQVAVLLRGFSNGIRAIVSDRGRGFRMNDAESNFGLGLTFICERVKLLGGQSSIRSAPDRGTRVEVFVPFSSSDLS
jgi:signal transduction histidine kinase